jgi:DNA-directed RNA polymerase subunit omega
MKIIAKIKIGNDIYKPIKLNKMARITVEDCVEVVPNRFELCLIASNRAKAILSGSNTNLDRKEKPAVIALREIANDLIDVEAQRKNIINSIKNRGMVDLNVNSSDENIVEAIAEETESNIILKDDTFVSENIEVND